MKTIILLFITCYSLTFFTTSCRSTKNIPTAISKKDTTVTQISINTKTDNDSILLVNETIDKIIANQIYYKTFSAKVKVEYDAEGQKVPDMTAYIRIKKDSIIWINIEKFLINIARIVITKDSFYVLNKLDKTIQQRPLSYLQEVTQIPFDFSTLENLIIGSPVYFQKPIATFKQNENTTAILCIGTLFKHLLTIDNQTKSIFHSKLDDVDINRNRTCDLSYSDYEKQNGKYFAKERTIVVSEKSKLQIDLKFKQYNFNEILTFPFTIPKNYKTI